MADYWIITTGHVQEYASLATAYTERQRMFDDTPGLRAKIRRCKTGQFPSHASGIIEALTVALRAVLRSTDAIPPDVRADAESALCHVAMTPMERAKFDSQVAA